MRLSGRDLFGVSVITLLAASVEARSITPPSNQVRLCMSGSGCDSCHRPDPVSTSNAVVTVSLTAPAPSAFPPATGYTPGTRYSFILRVVESSLSPRCDHPARVVGGCAESDNTCRFGFQVTAVPLLSCAATPVPAGCFMALTPDVQLAGGPCGTGLEFIEHNGMSPGCGVIPTAIGPTSQERTWAFDWIAPPAGAGTVRFRWAVNSANANTTNQNDTIYFENADWSEGVVVAGCDLLTASAPLTPPPDKAGVLFADTTTCAPKQVPPTVLRALFTATPTQDVDILDTSPSLTVYEVECPCVGTLVMRKNGLNVEARWM